MEAGSLLHNEIKKVLKKAGMWTKRHWCLSGLNVDCGTSMLNMSVLVIVKDVTEK